MFFKNRANAGKVIGGMIIILVVSLAVGLTGCTKRQNNITSESDITPTETEQAEYNDTSDKDAAAEPATDSTSEETPDITGEESGEDESENAGDMVFIFSSEDVEKYYAPTCIYADRYSDICEDGTREFRASWLKDTLAADERLRSTCCYYGTGVISRYGARSVERLGVCPAMWIDLNQ